MEFRVLSPKDATELQDFSLQRLQASLPSGGPESKLLSWVKSWRMESLEHYLPLGWSFAGRDRTGRLLAYFLAQPFLFMRSQTQSLWVEHFECENDELFIPMIELALGLAREKHLQRTLFFIDASDAKNSASLKNHLLQKGGFALADTLIEFKTTKG